MAAKAMVRVMRKYTSATSGSSRKPLRRKRGQNFGSFSRAMPVRPFFLASRWTIMKMPAKYSTAGKIARTAIYP